jgi:hypothetical protein
MFNNADQCNIPRQQGFRRRSGRGNDGGSILIIGNHGADIELATTDVGNNSVRPPAWLLCNTWQTNKMPKATSSPSVMTRLRT